MNCCSGPASPTHSQESTEIWPQQTLLSNLFFPFEINHILGNKKGLINFTKQLILDNIPLLLSKDQFIIEVLEGIEPESIFLPPYPDSKTEDMTSPWTTLSTIADSTP